MIFTTAEALSPNFRLNGRANAAFSFFATTSGTREDLIAHFEKPYFKIFAERLPALIVEDAETVKYETSGATLEFQK
jgi:hypothetical protein